MPTTARRRAVATAATLAVTATLIALASLPQAAGAESPSRARPAAPPLASTAAPWTPRVLTPKSTVRAIAKCGHTIYAVGDFRRIGHHGRRYVRRGAVAFDASTGAIRPWNPDVRGTVDAIALTPRCRTAFLGGKFTSIGRTGVHDLAAVTTTTGAVRAGFGHTTDGEVESLALVRGATHLLVGGAFHTVNGTARSYLASVDPATGAVTRYLRPRVTGTLPNSSGRSMVYHQAVSPRGDRLLITGDFDRVGGRVRHQVAELDLGRRHATVDPWRNHRLNTTQCADDMIFYARAATFSPDGKTIYVAATGFHGSSPFCDALTAFTNTAPAQVKWINKTGGDSLYSVAAAHRVVYIGGHERWADNPYGLNSCGNGCVPRRGIGAISARGGLATAWNPTRSRGRGADDLLLTRAGLWVASDTYLGSTRCAGRRHPGICFFPDAGS